jgi:hypothetical protein
LDGAGKSTTVENLSGQLEKLNLPFKIVHFYYNNLLLKAIRKFKPHKDMSSESMQKSVKHELKTREKGTKSALWAALILLDSRLQYHWQTVRHPRSLLVFDRFFPDYCVSFDFIGAPYNRDKLLRHSPAVDKYFLLTGEPNILHDRKPEHTIEFFQQCHIKYEVLAKELDMEVIDTTRTNEAGVITALTGSLAKA